MPPNLTHFYQSLVLAVNTDVKRFMKNTLNSWYTNQIMEQLEGVKLQSYL